jgi:hypothetical protein
LCDSAVKSKSLSSIGEKPSNTNCQHAKLINGQKKMTHFK